MEEKCNWPGCKDKPGGHHFIFDNAYCIHHYPRALKKHFREELEKWDGKTEPNNKFMNLFSRYIPSAYKERGEELPRSLSKGRLEDRTESHRRKDDNIIFTIIRHLNAWNDLKATTEVRQKWSFNLNSERLELLDEENI